jgi:hypothetical protein
MPATIFGNPAAAIGLYQAFYGKAPANATYVNNVALAAQNGPSALAAAIGANFASTPAADLAKLVLANLSISNATLETALGQIFTAYPVQARGQIVLNLTNLLSGLENDATYGAAAKAYNTTVAANNAYSSSAANTTDSTPNSTTGNEAPKSLVLTTAQDVLNGGAGNDNFRAVAGNPIGNQDQTTLNSSDIIDGGAGTDALIVNLLGNYGGGARIKNIETLQLGSNVAGAVSFDYNVNAGFNEISEVTKVVADQINVGETLNVNNVVRTIAGDTKVLPTISWENDSNTAVAGTVGYGYRAAEVTGTADAQNIQLKSVTNGTLNIGAGIETFNLKSIGTERVTLANSGNADTGNNATAADLISTGSLTKVVITTETATAEVGKAAGIIATGANQGLTDRTAAGADDLGLTTGTSAANLLSVGSRVTEVDASAATANVNVRFTLKSDSTGTDVTFKGGEGNDYVEFQLGKVTATGGKGADTFAFLNNTFLNSSFGSTDSIQGGEGSDTIQLGLNGAGTYNINTTEFNNKGGIEVLDVRANTSAIGLQDAFVAAADTGTFTVRYDRVNQTSATDATNVVGATNLAAVTLENNTTNTLDLTSLALNRAINVLGGSGSERLILNDSSFNANFSADLGTNFASDNVTANSADFDTITILNTAVVDSGDLANVKGVEGFVLAKSGAVTNSFTIELTETFLLNNTAAVNNANTVGDDSVFNIVTTAITSVGGATSGGVALAAGDTVTIDISNLLSGGALKASLAGRGIDLTDVVASGATVNYVVNGVAATAAQIAAVTKADADGVIATEGSAAGVSQAVITAGAAGGLTVGRADLSETITLNAAAAADTVVLNSASNADTVNNYAVANDSIQLSKAVFSALTTTAGNALTAGEFLSVANVAGLTGGSVAASTDAQQIIWVQATNELYYNSNGATAGGLTLIGTFAGVGAGMVVGEFSVIA